MQQTQTITKIGTITIPAGTEATRHYECAAWHTTIRTAKEQTCDLVVYGWPAHPGTFSRIHWKVSGEVVSADLGSRFGGVQYGEDKGGKRAMGTTETVGCERYGFALLRDAEANGWTIDIDPEWAGKIPGANV